MSKYNILTYTGKYFDFLEYPKNDFSIYDIAHALSNICRFNGHCREFYSVAQHSVIVSSLVSSQNALAGLLHDSAEAFLGDVTRPLKQLLPDYNSLEKKIQPYILDRFGIKEIPEEVKTADLVALNIEQRDLMAFHNDEWPCLKNLPNPSREIKIVPLPPSQAKELFLNTYYSICNNL